MSKSKKAPARKLSNPAPYRSEPKFGQIGLPENPLKNGSFNEVLADESSLETINPLRVVKQWKSVCRTCHMYLSKNWRNSQAEADQDALKHITLGHWTDYTNRYVG